MAEMRMTPAVVIKPEADRGKFLCWVTEKQELLELNIIDGTDIRPGSWINLKKDEKGNIVTYSDMMDPYLSQGNDECVMIQCHAKIPPEDYARQHKNRAMLFNPKLGWALAIPEMRDKVKELRNTTVEAVYCCIFDPDHFRKLHKKLGTIWVMLQLSTDLDENDQDYNAPVPWQKQEIGKRSALNPQGTSLATAPYVVVSRDGDPQPPEGRRGFGRHVKLPRPEPVLMPVDLSHLLRSEEKPKPTTDEAKEDRLILKQLKAMCVDDSELRLLNPNVHNSLSAILKKYSNLLDPSDVERG
ncbi:hypothetical protein QR680_006613 [Steinernema hermaphroditum]|uniref:Uncharacterized protein n=1 Tax=Steinernema hermaphroditum TaxID=289476 RepID=A0AA39HVZ2_9BILA|nr:hypothetical protein QR680_006613 [Steinernema hermaphroditum]